MIQQLKKPEYYLQPLRTLGRLLKAPGHGPLKTAFGAAIHTYPEDTMGRAIRKTGIYDIALTQLLWQLSKESMGKLVDVGANIGYTSLVMHAAKPSGVPLYSFEPNTEVLQMLRKNHSINGADNSWTILNLALSDFTGTSYLSFPAGYKQNHGIAMLAGEDGMDAMQVNVMRLDEFFKDGTEAIQLIKIDVEGHELQVLKGMEKLLHKKAIENIVYEDFSVGIGACQQYLEALGYRVFRIGKGWSGLLLEHPGAQSSGRSAGWEEPNYWATLSSHQQIATLCATGYSCIR